MTRGRAIGRNRAGVGDRRTGRLTPTTRELACLALGHDDDDDPRCTATDEQIVGDLVRELRALRALAGIGDEPVGDRQQARTVLDEALTEASIADAPDDQLAEALLDNLDDNGWALVRVDR